MRRVERETALDTTRSEFHLESCECKSSATV